MSYALEIRTEETPASADGFAISDLWMIPILLLALMFDTFSRHLASLKQMRRTRPMRKDWQSFYPVLRKCEWAIHMVCFEGARQIILGDELDLRAISFDPEPPDSFQPSMPRSAIAMHRRMEDLARFHADPERYVRRHAERLRGAKPAAPGDAPALRVVVSSTFFQNGPFFRFFTEARIRAPP